MVSLTGDTATGTKIMAAAAPTVKRLHLELGGKAPFIVFDDANLAAAVQGAVVGGYVNTGQDCTAATRVYVQRRRFESFLEAFVAEVRKIRVGDPTSMTTDMGPLISRDQRQKVVGMVERARQSRRGGGHRGLGDGWAGVLLRAHGPGRGRARRRGHPTGDLRTGGRR